ncbi:MAG: c-type cytochrome [Gemmatimonadales bacterium]|nr:c-type cytochrome [Gemmatimonadales bacterium]NIN11037.1 c-type cytochrome [Gemmatimonadales bacterium]NIN49634.1 c-type cytochrome [Gemmatimonadales bacterium]NIP07098.1 c-type cytochrome [Gemmatimonadales bacterium]NIQ99489.1 c-type cytochrome [Gemmatimonadales bacterium]
MIKRFGTFVSLLGLLAGCGGEAAEEQPAAEEAATPAVAAAAEAPSGPIDTALAGSGEQLFQTRGCIGCHTVGGGPLNGPDLQGVTDRREYGWIVAMVTNPDSMLQNDPVALELKAEYPTPMTDMGVSPDDARAIFEYLRSRESQ